MVKADQQGRYQMIGELLREGGILVLVFGFLDPLLNHNENKGISWFAGIVIFALIAIEIGIRIETGRST